MEKDKNAETNGEERKRKNSVSVDSPSGEVEEITVEGESEEITSENRQGLLKVVIDPFLTQKVLSKAVGFDITAIALPVTLNEPASFLMRLCEQMQYSNLLDKAASCDDSLERLAYVAVFSLTCYSVAERTGKPFNPLLGETFEYVDEQRGNFKFISEQVSHHPPIGACHAETNDWIFYEAQRLKTKFTGNSLDCSVEGSNNVVFKDNNEHYKWHAVRTCVHNIVIGKLWIDHFGEAEVVNKSTGEKAIIRMKQCGWFSKGWHEVSGEILDSKGRPCYSIMGKWNESIHVKALPEYLKRNPSDDDLSKKDRKKIDKELKKSQRELRKSLKKNLTSDEPVWVHNVKPVPLDPSDPGSRFKADWTKESFKMCEMPDSMKAILPPTDSRIRPDRFWLEKGDTKKASAEKYNVEEKQREERRKRERQGTEWAPRWFKIEKDEDGQEYYKFVGGYWEERDKRIQELK